MIRVLQALLVAAAVALGVVAVRLDGEDDVRAPVVVTADEPVRIARQAVTWFFAPAPARPRKGLDREVERISPMATEEFAEVYREQRAALTTRLRRNGLELAALVRGSGAGVEYLHERGARVLVAVDVTSTSPEGRSAVTDYRVRVHLGHDGDRWLITGMEQVG